MINLTREKRIQVLNIISFLLVVIVNYLANALPINDYQTGEVSEMYSNLFTPAGVTFSIWGIIYLLLAVFIIYQARGLFSSKKPPLELLNRIGYLFFWSSMVNIAWIFSWHYLQIVLSFIVMLVLVGVLTVIYHLRLDVGQRQVGKYEKYFVQIPFSLYKAWITVATVANFMVLTTALKWDQGPIPGEVWAVVALIFVTLVGIFVYRKRRDIFFQLVFIWALLGIIIKRIFVVEELVLSVVVTAILGILILIFNMIFVQLKVEKRKYKCR